MDSHELERIIKFRSESLDPKSHRESDRSTAQHSLPRGEYIQGNSNNKLNKNLVKLQPLDYKKGNDTDDSLEGSLGSKCIPDYLI